MKKHILLKTLLLTLCIYNVKAAGRFSVQNFSSQSIQQTQPQPAPPQGQGTLKDADKQKYEQEIAQLRQVIKDLKSKLLSANISVGDKVPETLKKAIDDFEQNVSKDQKLDEQGFKDILADINNNGEAEAAILLLQKLDDIAAKAAGDAKLQEAVEKITNILATNSNSVVGKIYEEENIRKQLLDRELFFTEAKPIYDNYMTKDVNTVNGSVLVQLIYVDKTQLSRFSPTTWNKFKDVLQYTTKDEALAVLYKIGKVAGFNPKNPNSLDGQKDAKTVFFATLLERVNDLTKGSAKIASYASLARGTNDFDTYQFVTNTLKNALPIDYIKVQNDILADVNYKNNYNNLKPQLTNLVKESPLLLLIQSEAISAFHHFDRTDAEKILNFLKYATLEEMRAVIYHMAQQGDIAKSEEVKYLYRQINEVIKERIAKNELDRKEILPAVEYKNFERQFFVMKNGNAASAPTNQGGSNPMLEQEYAQAETKAKAYQNDYNIVKSSAYITANVAKAPLLLLLEVPADKFNKLINESEIEIILGTQTKGLLSAQHWSDYSTLDELKAIQYHLVQSKIAFINSEALRGMVNQVAKIITDRSTKGQNGRVNTKKIQGLQLKPFKNLVNDLKS